MADEAGVSRLYGGIHIQAGDLDGRLLGRAVGASVWNKYISLISPVSNASVSHQNGTAASDHNGRWPNFSVPLLLFFLFATLFLGIFSTVAAYRVGKYGYFFRNRGVVGGVGVVSPSNKNRAIQLTEEDENDDNGKRSTKMRTVVPLEGTTGGVEKKKKHSGTGTTPHNNENKSSKKSHFGETPAEKAERKAKKRAKREAKFRREESNV